MTMTQIATVVLVKKFAWNVIVMSIVAAIKPVQMNSSVIVTIRDPLRRFVQLTALSVAKLTMYVGMLLTAAVVVTVRFVTRICALVVWGMRTAQKGFAI